MKKEEVGNSRQAHTLCNEELSGLCCSSSVVQTVYAGKLRWAGHVRVTRMEGNECYENSAVKPLKNAIYKT
jgi:hypothetical protein